MTPGALAWHLGAVIQLVTVLWPVDGGWLVLILDKTDDARRIVVTEGALRPANL